MDEQSPAPIKKSDVRYWRQQHAEAQHQLQLWVEIAEERKRQIYQLTLAVRDLSAVVRKNTGC